MLAVIFQFAFILEAPSTLSVKARDALVRSCWIRPRDCRIGICDPY